MKQKSYNKKIKRIKQSVYLLVGLASTAAVTWWGLTSFNRRQLSLHQALPSSSLPLLAEQEETEPSPFEPEDYQASETLDNPAPEPGQDEPLVSNEEYRIKKHATVYSSLREVGVDPADIYKAVSAARPVYDLAMIQAGTKFQLLRRGEEQVLEGITFFLSRTDSLKLELRAGEWVASMESKPIAVKVMTYQNEVQSSLWQSAVSVGLDPQAITLLSDIFAWQIDFEREIHPGDSWRMHIEQTFVDEQPYGWGNILVAEYKRGEERYQAIRFPQEGDEGEYYTPQGENLKSKFLKSPLRYSRISSHFQLKRFHPILGINRPHYGVDYAAPKGTPVRTVGEGVITMIGRLGGNGKMIKIRHNATYQTAYKHLNGYAKGLRKGSRVSQGQIIGYVGSTGLATGPHLHFEFYERGRYTDPLGRKFPREEPISPANRGNFQKIATHALARLKGPEDKPLTVAAEGAARSVGAAN